MYHHTFAFEFQNQTNMQKIILIVVALTLQFAAFAQNGFIYIDTDPLELSSGQKLSIETEDGCFIVADNLLSPSGQECISFTKLSADGVVLKRITLESLYVNGIFPDPEQDNAYYSICDNYERKSPCIVHIDEELDLLGVVDVVIPYDLSDYFQFGSRTVMDRNNKIVYAGTVIHYDGVYFNYYHLHLKFNLLGLVETSRMEADTRKTPTLFMLPDGRVCSYTNNTLSMYDDSLNSVTIHMYDRLDEDETMYIQAYGGDCSIAVLPDTSFIIADEVLQTTIVQYPGDPINHYENMAFFKSDLSGGVYSYIMVDSPNTVVKPAQVRAVDYTDPEAIYLCAYEDLTPNSWGEQVQYNRIFLKKVNQNMEVQWEKSFILGEFHYMPHFVLATKDGGCLITGKVVYQEDVNEGLFVFKVDADGLAGTAEIAIQDIRPYICCPNPVQGELHMSFSPDVQPTQIEIYDLQGRMVCSQHDAFENVEMTSLSSGAYLMRVIMKDGQVYTEKVMKE